MSATTNEAQLSVRLLRILLHLDTRSQGASESALALVTPQCKSTARHWHGELKRKQAVNIRHGWLVSCGCDDSSRCSRCGSSHRDMYPVRVFIVKTSRPSRGHRSHIVSSDTLWKHSVQRFAIVLSSIGSLSFQLRESLPRRCPNHPPG